MKKHILDLDYIINANNYRNIQDSIAEATDMAMLTVDYKGKPITHHSKCTELCKAVRAYPKYSQICEKCDSRGGLEATRLNQPYIYLCHMGIVDFAIPITVDGQYLGAVMGGQVLVENEQDKEFLEKITSQNTNILDIISKCDLDSLYCKLPVMKLDKIKAIATMIYNICNYIVEEALLKINLIDENIEFDVNSFSTESAGLSKVANPDLQLLDAISNDDDNVGISQKINYTKVKKLINHDHIILRPALEYIEKNYMRNIGLDSMASLCNISSSYFSKLFNKVAEDNFANYINKIRVNKAKEVLEKSDVPITNIALDLGFEDSGYFIKVFKKMEGITPSVYRSTKAVFE
ncbi:MAG TPA: PocR ligand-binding domain-containing protein [Ruminiclostridium sp.]